MDEVMAKLIGQDLVQVLVDAPSWQVVLDDLHQIGAGIGQARAFVADRLEMPVCAFRVEAKSLAADQRDQHEGEVQRPEVGTLVGYTIKLARPLDHGTKVPDERSPQLPKDALGSSRR